MEKDPVIYGAGLAGLLAATQFQTAQIIEANKEEHISHKALLRFRSPDVGNAIGIPFKKVLVRKGVSKDGQFVDVNIALANSYSQKVLGRTVDRSIWNLDPVERYIAPEDLIPQLVKRNKHRISFNTKVTPELIEKHQKQGRKIISTMPLPLTMDFVAMRLPPQIQFERRRINVLRMRIVGCDVYQTIYFPCEAKDNPVYRASITGDLLIVEFVDYEGRRENEILQKHLIEVMDAFNLSFLQSEPLEKVNQSHGKIAEIDSDWRKEAIHQLSVKHGIFSLGRFGTWRNILLDDVLDDISLIRKLMRGSSYELAKESGK